MNARAELGTLEATGLIQIASLEPELEYLFRHALVQDAAYSSLLKQDRRALHKLAAETLVSLYPSRARDLAGVIGMHFEEAGEDARAAEHLVAAGEYAVERFANREALSFFERAQKLLGSGDPRIDLRLRAAIGSAKVGWSFTSVDPFVDRLEAILADGGESGDPRLRADAYFWTAFLRRWRGEQPAKSAPLQNALENAARINEELGDPIAHAIPKGFMGVGMMMSGELRAGSALTKEALAEMEGTGDALSQAILSGLLTMTYARLGEFADAERSLVRGERLAERGDEIARLDALIAKSSIDLERGDLDRSVALSSECAMRSEELGATACAVSSNIFLGTARLLGEDIPGAKASVERSLELSRVTTMVPMRILAQGLLGAVQGRLGDLPAAAHDWDEALSAARGSGDRYGEAVTLWNRGRTHARQDNPDNPAAIADLTSALGLFEQMEARPAIARVLRDQADVLTALGEEAEAKVARDRSSSLAKELGLRDFS